MRKRKILRILFINLLIAWGAPDPGRAAFDAPDPNPVAFSLANLYSFPDFLMLNHGQRSDWYLATGGARLFEMPDIQPFSLRLSGPGLGGRWRLIGNGLKAGAYSEVYSGLAYGRALTPSLRAELEVCALEVSIKGYGSAWSGQINARVWWRVGPGIELALAWHNLNNARFGQDQYPLPRRFAVGGRFQPMRRADLFVELEKDTRYALSSRFGLAYRVYGPVTLLGGYQSNPDILSAGLSCLIGSIRATGSFQYHPDLGISQCYGLALTF